jgi:Endosomal/lysosomal potassium channel TMEM175
MRDEPFDKLRTALVEIRASALRQAQGVRGSGDVLAEPLDVDRLVVFSDAVFAIAATLLVLDIRIPPGLDSAEFHRALRGQLAAIVTYALSFAVIGQLWLTHHRIFSYIARVDYVLLGGSLILMGLVAFLPFPCNCSVSTTISPGRSPSTWEPSPWRRRCNGLSGSMPPPGRSCSSGRLLSRFGDATT